MPAPQAPHKQPTSIKNYDDDDPSVPSCILSPAGTSTFSTTPEPSRRRHCPRSR